MEDIKRVQLSEIAGLITKGTTPTTLGYEFQEDGVNFLKIECFDENGGFIESKVAHISEECNEKLKRSQLKAGDVLFSIAGAIGRVAIVTEEMLPANTNQALAIIRIADEQVYLPYIKLILTSPIVIEQFEKKKQGVAQLNLSLKDINEISIPLPSREKQIELAELFDKVAGVIAKRKTEISALDDLIKARFIEMFGDVKTNNKGWERVQLKDIADVRGRVGWKGYKKEDLREDGPLVLGATHLTDNGGIDLSDPVYLSREKYEESPEIVLQKDDLIFTQRGNTIGKVGLIESEIGEATINPCVLILRPIDINPVFFKSYFVMDATKDDMWMLNSGSAQPMITQKGIGEYMMMLPPIELQNEFADFVHQVDKSKFSVDIKRIKLIFWNT